MPASSQRPELVIFDCDGVLVDSEPIFNRVLHEFLISYGATLSFAECCETFTGKNRQAVEDYMLASGMNVPDDWSHLFYSQALEALEREVEPIDGVASVLKELRTAQVNFCVASNGIQEKMNVTLGGSNLLQFFKGKLFSAYDIGRSKPAPDVFLHAAKNFDVAPGLCVVVEDSPSGFQAASNANMRCYAYLPNGKRESDKLFGATVFDDMRLLPSLLGLC